MSICPKTGRFTGLSRRGFLRGVLTATGAVAAAPLLGAKRAATDLVPLGNTGIKVTRLALGTGTNGGRIQRELGQQAFTRLVRHAYDQGVRFFETADRYAGMQVMLGEALKGLPRDSYRLMTKFNFREPNNPQASIDRLRRELQSEYFDILLIHGVRSGNWPTELEALRDVISEAKQKKIVLSHGASAHGLRPIRAFPGNKWLEVALMRTNHNGTRMDNLNDVNEDPGDVQEVFSHVKAVHGQGTGVIGMKLIGEGRFTNPDDRQAAVNKVFRSGLVDAVTIGFKSTAEVDEAISRINTALNG
ncbi:MAG: aldo/keto reductase [Acidobacteria bacterium]|nr:aldo/keto reductase [Acidobacteriota bacterium]